MLIQGRSAADFQLAINIEEMLFHAALAEIKSSSNFLVAESLVGKRSYSTLNF
jgi:hypothetical protein